MRTIGPDVAIADEEQVQSLLRAILAGEVRQPDTWTLLADRLDDLDALSDFERAALPLLVARWTAEGRDVDRRPLVNGLRRKMVVRNRFLIAGARAALDRLRDADIPAVPLKGAALIGRVLPDAGLRPIADIDLWVRPADHAAALRTLAQPGSGRDGRATRDPHAGMLRDALGRELDVHRLPSELFARRGCSPEDTEALFARTWARRTGGRPALSDIVHLSFVNALFSHSPGEPRAAFALIELDAVLRHPDVTGTTLRAIVADAVEDRTALILVEHLDWLGPGVSGPLDRLLHDHLEPVLTADDRRLREWLVRSRHVIGSTSGSSDRRGSEPTSQRRIRQLAHAHGAVPAGTMTVVRWLAKAEAQDVRRRPASAITAVGRGSAWRRVVGLLRSIVRMPRPGRVRVPPV